MNNLLSRTLTGIIYVAIIVAGLCTGHVSFMALGCLLAGLRVAEFLNLTGNRSMPMLVADLAGALIVVAGMDTVATTWINGWSFPALTVWGLLFTAWFAIRFVAQIYSKDDAPLRRLACSMMALMYVALPVALMSCVYNASEGGALMMAVFVMIWLNDTGAYLVGSQIGRHKLFERLSPKKSWEGFIGGMILTMASAPAMYHFFPEVAGGRGVWFMVGLGMIVPIAATWGDLAESMLKRSLHVKDSGKILPGHGGILDRIDSLLLVVPVTVTYIGIWRLFA